MFRIVLYQPEIPPNTGNVIRLATNSGATLTLVRPLGFELNNSKLKRAGLDYREWADVQVCDSLEEAVANTPDSQVFAFTTKSKRLINQVQFQKEDVLLFGPETRGLPDEIRDRYRENCIKIPMQPESRSLNLSNSVAIALYEAWRQLGYEGAELS